MTFFHSLLEGAWFPASFSIQEFQIRRRITLWSGRQPFSPSPGSPSMHLPLVINGDQLWRLDESPSLTPQVTAKPLINASRVYFIPEEIISWRLKSYLGEVRTEVWAMVCSLLPSLQSNQGVCRHLPEHTGWGGGGGMRLLIRIPFFRWFLALYGPRIQLWCFRAISECSECKCPSFKTFWRTPVYIGEGLIPKMAVLSRRPQVVFVQIGSGLTSKFQNLSGLLDQAIFSPKFIQIGGSDLNSS